MTGRLRAALLLAAGAAAALAAFTVVSGGIDLRVAGIPIRSRSWQRPAVVAALLAAIALYGVRRQAGAVAWRALASLPWAAVAWAAAAGMIYGTHAAGGSDSYGYVSQAALFAAGRLTGRLPPDPAFSWPNAAATLTPLGYTQGRSPEVLAPIYPPGFPLLLTPFALVSPTAVFLLVPLCAAAVVFLVWRIGRRARPSCIRPCSR